MNREQLEEIRARASRVGTFGSSAGVVLIHRLSCADVPALLDEIDRLNQKIKSFEEFGSAEALRAEVAVEAGVRDAAWRAYLAEDDLTAAVNAAVRTAVVLTNRRWIAARERVQTRHASRPDGYCVMCRWPDGSLMRWPCPDYVDSQVPATTAEGSAEGGTSKGSSGQEKP